MDDPAASGHPDHDRLAAYAVGRLGPVDASAVEAHLAGCASCTSAIERRQEADSLLAVVQSLPPGQVRPASDPARPPAELVGHPRYRLDGLIGRGGMGVVWRATHLLMNRPVAVKVVHPDLARSPAAVARFRREVEAAARLDHPHIVRPFDAEQVGDLLLLVMELVDGPDLARVVADRGPLPVEKAVGYARQVCLGLQHAHDRGMVHRDIKPQNLLLAPDGTVKVADFGLAFVLAAGPHEAPPHASTAPDGPHTRLGDGCGTPDYIAPEQVRDAGSADIRSDLYSLGCTLYHLLAGRPPFAGGSGYSKVAGHLERTPPALALTRPDLPPALFAAIDTLLAKNPADRFQTPRAAADALAEALSDPQMLSRRWTRRRLIAAGAASVLVAGGATLLGRGRVPRAEERLRLDGHTGGVWHVALSADERLVVSGGEDQTARVWAVDDGRLLQTFTGHTALVSRVGFLPDGRRVATAGLDKTVRLWDVATGRCLRVFADTGEMVTTLGLSPDGRRLLSGGPAVVQWTTDTGAVERRLPVGSTGASWVGFSPDGRLAAAGGGERLVRLWLADTGEEVVRLGPHPHAVEVVAFSPDGGRLIAGGVGPVATAWEVATGSVVARYDLPQRLYRAMPTANGFLLVLNDDQSGLTVYDPESGRALARLENPGGVLWGCELTRDRQTAVTGGVDRAVRVWRLPGN